MEPEALGELAPRRLNTSLMSWEEQSRPPTLEPLPVPLTLKTAVWRAGAAAWRFLELFGTEPTPRGKKSGPGSKPMASSLAG